MKLGIEKQSQRLSRKRYSTNSFTYGILGSDHKNQLPFCRQHLLTKLEMALDLHSPYQTLLFCFVRFSIICCQLNKQFGKAI
ncbi:hypothetical protein CICLE_v10023130mg [Citrus x clementina]|uniref:Uncharacterized protein n=2 Tax=Citrus TaxID=2706 RepID=V4VQQ7_CITCL|nr:hypothetical protein CICLE_v10023130mg [Citrus x clementina]GAY57720.1 hypothetical protein CUMW_181620 [Citrus unshiu]